MLAEEIAAELFTGYDDCRKGDRISVVSKGIEIGGWCERSVVRVVEKRILKFLTTNPQPEPA